jgi:hypothetical protein
MRRSCDYILFAKSKHGIVGPAHHHQANQFGRDYRLRVTTFATAMNIKMANVMAVPAFKLFTGFHAA